ncbi:MAG: carboxypeptidase regulatory-like domain-containing protein, partial [Bacteroidetes bacterium]
MKFTNGLRVLVTLLAVFAVQGVALAQGVTTSTLQGVVEDANGERLIGANVLAVHEPSGTIYGTATDLEGNFRIPGMRVGGPYKVTVSYTGYG